MAQVQINLYSKLLHELFSKDGRDEEYSKFIASLKYRKRLHTTNSIEGLNEEIRRREIVIRIFPNEASVIRLIGALLIEQHEKWITGKIYFTMGEY
ncbi:MAG: transposase [Candidatus Cloacimonadota bacterium]|nr:transposase [Candidatus Cloacimonadota bacterium]